MVRVENVRTVDASGNAVLDLQVSTVAELPALGGYLPNSARYKVAAGTIAQVIQTGEWATLDTDGNWYNSDGSGVV